MVLFKERTPPSEQRLEGNEKRFRLRHEQRALQAEGLYIHVGPETAMNLAV